MGSRRHARILIMAACCVKMGSTGRDALKQSASSAFTHLLMRTILSKHMRQIDPRMDEMRQNGATPFSPYPAYPALAVPVRQPSQIPHHYTATSD
ncbi:hypothetical protein CLCR_01767 [Cladophialophora carrionii]|uniref:Uncharacterized protein n=1 Tax=Cladophialophora carrionii TaxID=86049 RepID=A0A1C1CBK6_9EURO|nr:hypothetical protein CLCR_01767 [Cladophialophora carrionii]